ncbi:MAG: biopolymer transporter ExbD [Treponema sp.]|jgi:biopolymer transport protein ExbD|nr:biopolymer transporter ExbD [Treponema sp.]
MTIKRKKKSGFLETCATSDLAFLLIIYFIVIAGFNINQGFIMNLPARDSVRSILREELLRFEIDEEGHFLHADNIFDIHQTRVIISTAQKENPNTAVILTIDGKAHWQNVVSFVELAQDLSIEAFSFTMKKDIWENLEKNED